MPRSRKATESISLDEALRTLGETLRVSANTPNIYGYQPHAKQIQFHTSEKKRKLYIGGNRSGKTVGGVIEDIWWATGTHPYRDTPEPPVRGRVIGVDFDKGVGQILLPAFARWLPPSAIKGGAWSTAYAKQERVLTFENGSTIEFMSYDQDLDKFAGTSRHFIHMDEEPPQPIYTENTARLVDTGGSLWMTMTPVEGMTWVYETLYEPGTLGSDTIAVIEVDMTDNPHLNPLEVQEFLESLSPEERESRVHGKFVQRGGLIYKNFDPTPGGLHVLKVPLTDPPPLDWTWVVSLDHGFNNPTAILWHAISPDGKVLTFHELYGSGSTIDKWALRIHQQNQLFGRAPDYYVGDPSIRNTDPITGTSIHQEYVQYGIPFTLANNDVKAGIIKVQRYMQPQKDGVPLWRVTPNCENLIRYLARYRWKTYASKKLEYEHNVFEEPHKKDDHAPDSLRYFIMSRPELGSDRLSNMGPGVGMEQAYNLPRPVMNTRIADPRHNDVDPKISGGDYSMVPGEWSFDEYMGGEW